MVDRQSESDRTCASRSDPFARLGSVIAEALTLVRRADGAAVELLGDDGCTTVVAGCGTLADAVGTRLEATGTLSGLAVETATLLRAHDADNDPRVDREICRRLGIGSMLCVPLLRGQHAVGVLKVTASQPGMFTQPDVQVLSSVAGFLSAVVAEVAGLCRGPDSHMASLEMDTDRAKVSEFVTGVLTPRLAETRTIADRLRTFLTMGQLAVVFQPIRDLGSNEVVGHEALARFADGRPPATWFQEAARVGLATELELFAVAAAIEAAPPAPTGFLAVNVSEAVLLSPRLAATVEQRPPHVDLVLELTEYEALVDPQQTGTRIAALREHGVRVAADNVGNGGAALRDLVGLQPDIIKLDRRLVSHVDSERGQWALVVALSALAEAMSWMVVAEGIERPEELVACQQAGIRFGQGYLLGRPGPLSAAQSWANDWLAVSEQIYQLNQGETRDWSPPLL